MKAIKNRMGNGTLMPAVLIGIGVALLVTTIGCLLGSFCILNEYFGITFVRYLGIAILFLASLIGTYLAGVIHKEKRIITCAIVVAAYCLLNICFGMLIFNGVGDNALLGIPACFVGGLGGLILNNAKGTGKFRGIRRKDYR